MAGKQQLGREQRAVGRAQDQDIVGDGIRGLPCAWIEPAMLCRTGLSRNVWVVPTRIGKSLQCGDHRCVQKPRGCGGAMIGTCANDPINCARVPGSLPAFLLTMELGASRSKSPDQDGGGADRNGGGEARNG